MPSKPADTGRWLHDIQHNIHLAMRFTDGLDVAAFAGNDMAVYAVTRCLEITSEASRRLPEEVRVRHPAIPWKEMAGAGNIYRHDYEDVAARRVWRTVTKELPVLLSVVETELAQLL